MARPAFLVIRRLWARNGASAPQKASRARPSLPRFSDDRGASALFGLIVASGVFTVGFVQVVDVSNHEALRAPSVQERIDLLTDAQRLSLDLLGAPGTGWYADNCDETHPSSVGLTPESVTKIGLAREKCPGADRAAALQLDYAKLKDLQQAGLGVDPTNAHLDYGEAQATLGEWDHDFHVRTRVTLPDVEARLSLGNLDANLLPLYVGDYRTEPPPYACGARPVELGVEVWFEVTNDGPTDAAFLVNFTVPVGDGHVWSSQATPPLASGETHRATALLPPLQSAAAVTIRLEDPWGVGLLLCLVDLGAFCVPDYVHFSTTVEGFILDGVSDILVELGPSITYSPPLGWFPGPAVRPETTFIDRLVQQFDPNVMLPPFDHSTIPYQAEGDILPDVRSVLSQALPPLLLAPGGTATLDLYNVLVIGSDVDLFALLDPTTIASIEAWVRAGGLVIVLGGGDLALWASTFLGGVLLDAPDEAEVLDADDPLLTVPNRLMPERYDTGEKGWFFPAGEDGIEVVVASGDGAVVAATLPGAIGDGRVILSSWTPYDATGAGVTAFDPLSLTGDEDGLRILQNFLGVAYDDLNLDYGPSVPSGRPVATTSRLVTVWHPVLEDFVELTAYVYVY